MIHKEKSNIQKIPTKAIHHKVTEKLNIQKIPTKDIHYKVTEKLNIQKIPTKAIHYKVTEKLNIQKIPTKAIHLKQMLCQVIPQWTKSDYMTPRRPLVLIFILKPKSHTLFVEIEYIHGSVYIIPVKIRQWSTSYITLH